LQLCAPGYVIFFLRHQGRDGGVHFGGFGAFFFEGFGVVGGLRFEVDDGLAAGALGFWDVLLVASCCDVYACCCLLGLTFEFGNIHAKGIALFEHALTAALDKLVEPVGEGGHALA
jgi:hypothetical protein